MYLYIKFGRITLDKKEESVGKMIITVYYAVFILICKQTIRYNVFNKILLLNHLLTDKFSFSTKLLFSMTRTVKTRVSFINYKNVYNGI